MRLKDFGATVARRWYLVLVAVLLSAGMTYLVVDRVGPSYQIHGAELIFPPVAKVDRDPAAVTVGNPYLALDGVTLARDIVIRSLMSKTVADQIAEQIPGSSFEAVPDVMTNAPIISVTVEARSASDATDTMTAVLNRIPEILTELQAGLDLGEADVITSQQLIADAEPEILYKDQIRAGIVAAVGSLGLSLLLIGWLDGLLISRKRPGRTNGPDAWAGIADSEATARPRRVAEPSSARQGNGASRRLGPRAPGRTSSRLAPPANSERDRPDALEASHTGANQVAVR